MRHEPEWAHCRPHPFVHRRAPPRLASYLAEGTPVELDEDQVLHHFSEPFSHVYFVEKGEIAGIIASEDGATRVLHLAGDGCMVGEMFAFAAPPQPALGALVATKPTVVRRTPVKEFRIRLRNDPELAEAVMTSLSLKAIAYAKQVEDMCLRNVRRRLACILLDLFEASSNGRVCSISQETLADMAMAHRVTVTRTLEELENMDIIAVGRRKILLLDQEGLRKEASATDR